MLPPACGQGGLRCGGGVGVGYRGELRKARPRIPSSLISKVFPGMGAFFSLSNVVRGGPETADRSPSQRPRGRRARPGCRRRPQPPNRPHSMSSDRIEACVSFFGVTKFLPSVVSHAHESPFTVNEKGTLIYSSREKETSRLINNSSNRCTARLRLPRESAQQFQQLRIGMARGCRCLMKTTRRSLGRSSFRVR